MITIISLLVSFGMLYVSIFLIELNIPLLLCSIGLLICSLSLLSINLAPKIFYCIIEEKYKKQWIPLFGIFYSLYLRKKYGHYEGYIFCSYKDEFLFYNFKTMDEIKIIK